jgi:transposase
LETEPTKPDGSDDDDPNPSSGSAESAPKKRTGGRQPLARHLKGERIVHDLAEEEKHCSTGQKDLRPIGEESSERYEYIPAQLSVIEDIGKKYACAYTVKTAAKPPQPIEKSMAEASLLAAGVIADCPALSGGKRKHGTDFDAGRPDDSWTLTKLQQAMFTGRKNGFASSSVAKPGGRGKKKPHAEGES